MITFANLHWVLLTYLSESWISPGCLWISPGCSYEFNVVYVQREISQYLLSYNNITSFQEHK